VRQFGVPEGRQAGHAFVVVEKGRGGFAQCIEFVERRDLRIAGENALQQRRSRAHEAEEKHMTCGRVGRARFGPRRRLPGHRFLKIGRQSPHIVDGASHGKGRRVLAIQFLVQRFISLERLRWLIEAIQRVGQQALRPQPLLDVQAAARQSGAQSPFDRGVVFLLHVDRRENCRCRRVPRIDFKRALGEDARVIPLAFSQQNGREAEQRIQMIRLQRNRPFERVLGGVRGAHRFERRRLVAMRRDEIRRRCDRLIEGGDCRTESVEVEQAAADGIEDPRIARQIGPRTFEIRQSLAITISFAEP